jgi:hypothetical protein
MLDRQAFGEILDATCMGARLGTAVPPAESNDYQS